MIHRNIFFRYFIIVLAAILLLGTTSCQRLSSFQAAGPVGQEHSQLNINADNALAPVDNQGQKWRLAYCESDPYVNYAGHLYGILQGLEEAGWLENLDGLPYEQGQDDARSMWQWLAENDTGPYLEFAPEQFYSLLADSDERIAALHRSLQSGQDFDLMLAMGTYAGTVATENEPQIPVLVFSASNAVNAGIVKGEEYSGRSLVWAHMDSRRFQRQLTVFHDIFHFQKLGIVYEDSDIGRSYAALEDIRQAAAQQHFTIIERHVTEPEAGEDSARYYREMQTAYTELSAEVDAVYVTVNVMEPERLPELFAPFYARHIPISSQLGESEVQYGALVSITMLDFVNIGRFGAETVIRSLQGEDPCHLGQVFASTPRLSVNLQVAEKIGYQFPFELLLVADKAFTEIGDDQTKNEGDPS